jgi:hypothetical protein
MTPPSEPRGEFAMRLDWNEALVLHALLARWIDGRRAPTPASALFESSAECPVLHNLLCDLEAVLDAPLRPDYAQSLEAARETLAARWSGRTLRT